MENVVKTVLIFEAIKSSPIYTASEGSAVEFAAFILSIHILLKFTFNYGQLIVKCMCEPHLLPWHTVTGLHGPPGRRQCTHEERRLWQDRWQVVFSVDLVAFL